MLLEAVSIAHYAAWKLLTLLPEGDASRWDARNARCGGDEPVCVFGCPPPGTGPRRCVLSDRADSAVPMVAVALVSCCAADASCRALACRSLRFLPRSYGDRLGFGRMIT
jgi:hypothetical protein